MALSEQYGAAIAQFLRGFLDGLDLTPAQRELLPGLMRQHQVVIDAQLAS